MKNVHRPPIPNSLREDSEKWTKDLMTAIANYKKTGKKIPDTVKNRYKQNDVLEALKQMYGDAYGAYYCCYCESPIEPVSFPHIEHRKPKYMDLFPNEAFNWDNLHLACETCNVNKGTKWDAKNEILDAVNDVPIEEHLGYRVEVLEGVYRETLSQRGVTTEKHADLNRPSLKRARLLIWKPILDEIKQIISLGDDPRVHTAKQFLSDKCKGQHGSFIKWILQDWGIIDSKGNIDVER